VATTLAKRACSVCGTLLADDSPYCPVCALRMAVESARSRFQREARAAASVHHSNITTVHHLGESGGNYFYAMEWREC
jgi:serine/threonine protein kinase